MEPEDDKITRQVSQLDDSFEPEKHQTRSNERESMKKKRNFKYNNEGSFPITVSQNTTSAGLSTMES
jgi:hypothetical protein